MHLVFPAIPGNIGRIFSVGRDSGRSDSDRCSASDAEPESHKKNATKDWSNSGQTKMRCFPLFFSGVWLFFGGGDHGSIWKIDTKNNIRRLSSSFVFLMFLGISLWSWPATATLFGTGTQRYTNSNTEAITAPRHLKWRPPRKSWARKPQSHCCLCFICQVESWTRLFHLSSWVVNTMKASSPKCWLASWYDIWYTIGCEAMKVERKNKGRNDSIHWNDWRSK